MHADKYTRVKKKPTFVTKLQRTAAKWEFWAQELQQKRQQEAAQDIVCQICWFRPLGGPP